MALLWRKVTTLRKDYRVVVMAVLNPTIQIALMSVAITIRFMTPVRSFPSA